MKIEELYKLYLQNPSVQTDTRKLTEGDIFFALKGPNFNGNQFAEKALTTGAAYVIVDEKVETEDNRIIQVEDSLKTLQELASYHRDHFKFPSSLLPAATERRPQWSLFMLYFRRIIVLIQQKAI